MNFLYPTGGSSYTTAREQNRQGNGQFFPILKYHLFETGDASVILRKLKEFNQKSAASVSEIELENMISLTNGITNDSASYDVLFKLLEWPEGNVTSVFFTIIHFLRRETIGVV